MSLKAMVEALGPSTKKINQMREEARQCVDVSRLQEMVEELADAVWMAKSPPTVRPALPGMVFDEWPPPPSQENLCLDDKGNGYVLGYRVVTAK